MKYEYLVHECDDLLGEASLRTIGETPGRSPIDDPLPVKVFPGQEFRSNSGRQSLGIVTFLYERESLLAFTISSANVDLSYTLPPPDQWYHQLLPEICDLQF